MNRLLREKKRFVGYYVVFFLIFFLIHDYLINYLLLSKISRYCDLSLKTMLLQLTIFIGCLPLELYCLTRIVMC